MADAIYAVPVADKWLIHSPAHGLAALTSISAVQSLRDWADSGAAMDPARIPPALQPLVDGLSAPAQLRSRHNWPPFLGLIVTRDCTMGCHYCDFGGRELALGPMSPEVAIAAIDGWAECLHRLGAPELNLHFFGGEPFLVPDLVQIAVHRTRALASARGLGTHFEATTNGLLEGATLEFAADYFDTLVFSIDGPEADHDRHRPLAGGRGSFRTVHRALERLQASPVEICLRCCVSSLNQDHMLSTAEWFIAEYRPAIIDFEPMQVSGCSAPHGLSPPDPVTFARGFLAARRIARAAGVECVHSTLHDPAKTGFCPVDQQAYIVAPNGNVRCCYLPAERWEQQGHNLEIGQVHAKRGLAIRAEALARIAAISAEQPACRTCFCRAGCGGGCLLQHGRESVAGGYSDFCRETRLIQAGVWLDDMNQQQLTDALLSAGASSAMLSGLRDDRLAPARLR